MSIHSLSEVTGPIATSTINLQGRTIVVTGAGGGIGRAHALALAAAGAHVVVNDLRGASQVVTEIRELGGSATPSSHDITDWDQCAALVHDVLLEVDAIHGVVNNAGIVRDRLMVNLSAAEWDDVIRVHLRGTFCVSHHVAGHWRDRHKAGNPVNSPRIVNTSSPSGLFGNVGQTNYGAAKAGIASFTIITADELARYGAMVNAIAPTAMTAMTADLTSYKDRVMRESAATGFDTGAPENVAPLAVWLSSVNCQVTGRVFAISGGSLSVVETWVKGPTRFSDQRWTVDELAEVLPELVAAARPNSAMTGFSRASGA